MRSFLLLSTCVLMMAGCSGPEAPVGEAMGPPILEAAQMVTADGYVLPLRYWPAEGAEAQRAVVLALHGFNDHGGGFAVLAGALVAYGVSVYAYDQRGFGATADAGACPGKDTLVADARTAAELLRERYPDTPVYLLGKSMGGAVALLLMSDDRPAPVDGTVLVSPAVVGEDLVPRYQSVLLRLADSVVPGLPLPAGLGPTLGYRPSDDPAVMERLRQDPLVLDYPRVHAVAGLASLMDAALAAAPELEGPVLLLYGARDDLVPIPAMCRLLEAVELSPGSGRWRAVVYPEGYHLLTRYSGAAQTQRVIGDWLFAEPQPGVPVSEARLELCRPS